MSNSKGFFTLIHVLPWGGLSSLPRVPEFWNPVRGRHFSKWSLRILSQMVSALPLSGKLGEVQDHEGKLCGAPWMEEMIIFTVPATRKVKTLCLFGMRVEGLALQLGTGKPPRPWGSGGLECRQRECGFTVHCKAGKASWGDDPSIPLYLTPLL